MLGIAQSTYSYWENDTVAIDHKSMVELAKFYKVQIEYLGGDKYMLRNPPSQWPKELRDKYDSAKDYAKEYMEYLYGNPCFHEYEDPSADVTLDSTLGENSVIYCRDGKNVRINFSKEGMDLFLALSKTFSEDGGGK